MSESLITSFCLSIKGLPAIGYCSLSIQFSFQTCYWSCVPQGQCVHSLKHLAVKNFLLPCIYFIPLQFHLVSVLNNSSPYFCSSNIYSVLCSIPSSFTPSTFQQFSLLIKSFRFLLISQLLFSDHLLNYSNFTVMK